MKVNKIFNFLVLGTMFALFFAACYIEIGFALKPYMFMALISLAMLVLLREKKIGHFEKVDFIYVLFIIYILLSSLTSNDFSSSLRYVLGMILVYVFYLINKKVFTNVKRVDFEKILVNVSIIYAVISFVYYFMGIYSLGFRFVGNNIMKYGVLMDRQMPRLISLASSDPNITSCFFGLPFCYFLTNHKNAKEKVGLVLYFVLIVLTLSRGAFLSLIVTFIYYSLFVSKGFLKKIFNGIKILVILLLVFPLVNFTVDKCFNFSLSDLISSRMSSLLSDGGSGRKDLWNYAFEAYLEHPITGIGINNTLTYNKNIYNEYHYTHNTYLEVLSELGTIGFVLYVFILILIYRKMSIYKKVFAFPICFFVFLLCENMFLSLLINELFFFALIFGTMYNKYYFEEERDV